MKKLLLLLAAGSFAVGAGAQQRHASSIIFGGNANVNKAQRSENKNLVAPGVNTQRTTTTGGARWYDYVDSVLALNTNSVASVGATLLSIWNDTTAIYGYDNSGTPAFINNKWTSLGTSFDPMAPAFNDPATFPGVIKVAPTNAYVIDSVRILGSYIRPLGAASGSYTDQLNVSLVYGNGTSTSDLPTYYFTGTAGNYPQTPASDTLRFIDMLHDSTNNRADVTTPPGSIHNYTFSLMAADTAVDFDRTYPVSFSVPAANFSAISISFKSGDATYPAFPAQDTVEYADGTAKRGSFSQLIAFAQDQSGTTVAFPPYSITDQTIGYFKQEGSQDGGWGGNYLPNFAYTNATTGGAYFAQYPVVMFHVTCATCALTSTLPGGVSTVSNVNNIQVYPNPANGQVNITFSGASADATVSLTNMLGQVVANTTAANGAASINTANLAAGMYIYSITSNGVRTTGHVEVAH